MGDHLKHFGAPVLFGLLTAIAEMAIVDPGPHSLRRNR